MTLKKNIFLLISGLLVISAGLVALYYASEPNAKIQRGFDTLTSAYDPASEFHQTSCGSDTRLFTQMLGVEAHRAFRFGKKIEPDRRFDYCANGFFLGFIETLADKKEEVFTSELERFCNSLATHPKAAPDAALFCIRGFAQGITEAAFQKYTQVDKIIEAGINFCNEITAPQRNLEDCGGGVFNEIAFLYSQSIFFPDKENPLNVCAIQEQKEFQSACYRSLTGFVFRNLAENDFLRSAAYFLQIRDSELAKKSIENLATRAAHSLRLNNQNDSDIIQVCRKLSSSFHSSCIVGFAAGFKNPEASLIEEHRGLQICSHNTLTSEERDLCFRRIMWIASQEYSRTQQVAFCSSVPEAYRYFCPKDFNIKI